MASKIIFFMGVPASGKTYWSERLFPEPEYTHLCMLRCQDRVLDEYRRTHGMGTIAFAEYRELLMKANEQLLAEALERIAAGEPVVIEGTFYKAKRRITFADAIRQVTDEPMELYLVSPDEAQFEENVRQRKLMDSYGQLRREREEIEFPNRGEGFARIFEIRGGQIEESRAEADMELPERARAELAREAEQRDPVRRQQKERQREEKRRRKQEVLKKLKDSQLPFLHVCEVCGKEEFLTTEEAFQACWDYPPTLGNFGVIFPRTCGDCIMQGTLWWARVVEKKSPQELSPKHKQVMARIMGEPWNLLEEPMEEDEDEEDEEADFVIRIRIAPQDSPEEKNGAEDTPEHHEGGSKS